TVSLGPDGNSGVQATVADTGPGVASEFVDCLFERFKTTKGDRGLGLGLSIARGIAQDHGGDVTLVKSGPDGATFRLVLARAPQLVAGQVA
ncbi:MAG TPA: HAMP domain-containing sensor histidine kinase, partial [Planctomycetia bacterium]|nr:HAMP domain-containing sensor histidine kinase [Planctomycetia bacterium]